MKTTKRISTLLGLSLLAAIPFSACSADISGAPPADELDETIEAPSFEAEDSRTSPTMGRPLSGDQSVGAEFNASSRFLAHPIFANPGSDMFLWLSASSLGQQRNSLQFYGWNLALYKRGADGRPSGRALKLGTLDGNESSVKLEYTQGRDPLTVLVYRTRNGSRLGAYQLDLDVIDGNTIRYYESCTEETEATVCEATQYCREWPSFNRQQYLTGYVEGRCADRLEASMCGRDWNHPVCARGGVTYQNECLAAVAGLSIEHQGACVSADPRSCGAESSDCGPDEYCDVHFGETYLEVGQSVCKPRPVNCWNDWLYQPVCGADNRTYTNQCEANAAGIFMAHGGVCDPN